MAHDKKCYELAEYFLPGRKWAAQQRELADEIQKAIENWLEINNLESVEDVSRK